MKKCIKLTDKDIGLLVFLASYKIISLDNASYIYDTITYQEKRIVKLVKYGYVKRLKHRFVTLGLAGKKYLEMLGISIKEHCRNDSNIERLQIISDIASFMSYPDHIDFIPSWELKSPDEPTSHSRKYLGVMTFPFPNDDFLTYYICGKNKRYITSIYYDIKRQSQYKNIIVFTNDVKELMYRKNDFSFGRKSALLIPYNEYNKFILRNYIKIVESIYKKIESKYTICKNDKKEMDLKLEDGRYFKIMPFINMETLSELKCNFNIGSDNNMHLLCLEDYEPIIREYIPKVSCIAMNKQFVQNLVYRNSLINL